MAWKCFSVSASMALQFGVGLCARSAVDPNVTTRRVMRMGHSTRGFITKVQHGGSARRFKTGVRVLAFGMLGVRRMAHNFRELVSWQLAFELSERIHKLLQSGPASKDFKFRDQLADSARSAPRNIAEGFGRFNPTETAQFVDYARASLDETENHLREGV